MQHACSSRARAICATMSAELPTEQDDLLCQALAMGPQHFSAAALVAVGLACREGRRLALAEAAARLVAIGWPYEESLPAGLPGGGGELGCLPTVFAACVLDGVVVAALPETDGWQAARFCRLLRTFGATVLETTSWATAPDGGDLVLPPGALDARRDRGGSCVNPLAAGFEAFIFSPFATTCRTFTCGKELRVEQAEELRAGFAEHHGHGDVSVEDVRNWSAADPDWDSNVTWQDLSLRTHLNVRTGDVVREWNYGMGDNSR